ncbi:MAG TPA: ABC transporter ATP-binding protein, partial [Polyangia bacterium]|nr:ABC transporter ATP-binding protein [Polyangia bacterium]
MAEPTAAPSPRVVRRGLFGGLVSSKQRRSGVEPGEMEAGKKKPKKPLSLRVVMNDAVDLVRARKGRLALGLFLMTINRLCGLVLPWTTKYLLDEVIGKGNRAMLGQLVFAAGAATLAQGITSFSLAQVLGKAAQRSITDMRREVQRHVGRLSVGYFEQTKAGALLSRVMNDAEGIRNLVGTGLVELVGGAVTAVLATGILFYLSAKLTLIALGVLSLFAVIMAWAFKTLRPLFRERS